MMDTLLSLLPVYAAYVLATASPGPSNMAIMATAAFVYSLTTTSFRWVQFMFFLCIIQDLATSQFELT